LELELLKTKAVQDGRAGVLKDFGLAEIIMSNGNKLFGTLNADNLIFGAGTPKDYGIMLYTDGTVYRGEFDEGSHKAPGIFYNEDGTKNFEYIKNDYGSGMTGIKYFSDGARIEGCFDYYRNPHGKFGIKEFRLDKNSNEYLAYEGGFEQGKRQGHGAEYMTDSTYFSGKFIGATHYKGEFYQGERHGKGRIYGSYFNKEVEYIMGKLTSDIDNNITGTTAIYLKDGAKYEGDLIDGKRCGKGVLTSKYGVKVYEGEWRDDKYHGVGIEYNDRDPEDEKTSSYRNQTRAGAVSYEGEFKDGKRNGIGNAYYSNTGELWYSGEFKDNRPHGKVTEYHGYRYKVVDDNSYRQDGEFINGKNKVNLLRLIKQAKKRY